MLAQQSGDAPGKRVEVLAYFALAGICFFFWSSERLAPAFADIATISDRDVSELWFQEARKITGLIVACL